MTLCVYFCNIKNYKSELHCFQVCHFALQERKIFINIHELFKKKGEIYKVRRNITCYKSTNHNYVQISIIDIFCC